MLHKGAKYSFMGYPCDISHLSLISGREFKFRARKLISRGVPDLQRARSDHRADERAERVERGHDLIDV